MHYVSGHEVAEQIIQEVGHLALSPTIAWNQATLGENKSSSYWCQVGDVLATKEIAHLECPPQHLVDIILHTNKLGYGSIDISILEEYDSNNQITLIKLKFPQITKLVKTIIYRCVCYDKATERYFVVFQSIDHEAMNRDDNTAVWWQYAPSGYVISPIPDDPNKCELIFVAQITDMGNEVSSDFVQLFCQTGGMTAKAIDELREQARLYKGPVSYRNGWRQQINDMRRDLYTTLFDLSPENDWKASNHRGIEVFKKADPDFGGYHVAMRSSFFSSEPCQTIASRIYDALLHTANWNTMTFKSTILEEIGDGACVVLNEVGSYETGAVTDTLLLITCNFNRDGICDIAFRSIEYDKYPPVAGRPRTVFPMCGFIVSPNPHGSTIQYLLQPPPSHDEQGMKISAARLISYIHNLRSYVTRQPKQGVVAVAPSTSEYTQVFGEFANIMLSDMTSPPLSTPSSAQASVLKKRKYSASLVSVEELVRKIVPGESPIRPFLFLVPNSQDGLRSHRFVRRRWNSSLTHSVFDLLPEELFEHIVSYLDFKSLLQIPLVCARFKNLMTNKKLWAGQYLYRYGRVYGQIAKRYCGDEDPNSFFTDSFTNWKDLFWEKTLIESAWEAPAQRAHRFRVDHAHIRAIRALVQLPQCHRIISGSHDKLVRIWDTTQGGCLATLQGVSGVVALHAADGYTVKAGYKSGAVKIIDVRKGECLQEIRLGEAMRGCTFLSGRIATWDEEIDIWDEATQQQLYSFKDHTHHITECIFSEKNSILFSASRDKTVKMWDLNSRTTINTITGHTRGVNGIALVGDFYCVTVASDASMRVWDLRNIAKPLHVRTETGKIRCVQYTGIGKKICTGGTNGVHIWSSETFEHIRHDPVDPVASLALNEENIAYGHNSGVLQFYDFVPRGYL